MVKNIYKVFDFCITAIMCTLKQKLSMLPYLLSNIVIEHNNQRNLWKEGFI